MGWGRGVVWSVGSSVAPLPELGEEEAAEPGVAMEAGEACGFEGGGVVGELGDAEAGEDAEAGVEGADVGSGGCAGDGVLRETEVGDEPEGIGGGCGGEGLGELVEFGLGEAVEDEVGDDEVGGWWWGCRTGAGIAWFGGGCRRRRSVG